MSKERSAYLTHSIPARGVPTGSAIPAGRASERGVAIFMVVMVLTIISAIGVYAVRAVSQVDMATGNVRHSIQAQYGADFAIHTFAADIARDSATFGEEMEGKYGGLGRCRFNSSSSCLWKEGNAFAGTTQAATPNLPGGMLGSLNHDMVTVGTAGVFSLEADNYVSIPGSIEGESESTYRQIDVLAIGQILPAGAPAGSCTGAYTIATGMQRIRGHFTFGPFLGGMRQ